MGQRPEEPPGIAELNGELSDQDLAEIEAGTQEFGRYILTHLDERPHYVFQRRWWDDRIMNWAMEDEALKVQLFRFVDVLPMLTSHDAVVERLLEYLDGVSGSLPMPARVALGLARRNPLVRAAVARAARLSAMDFARRFIAGTSIGEVLAAARREREAGRGFTLDILGEAVTSDQEAEKYFLAYIELIEKIAPTVNTWKEVPQIDQGVLGPLPRVNLSIKLSALDSQFDAIDTAGVTRRVGARLRELLRVARRHQAFLNVDMESYAKKDLTLHIFRQVLLDAEFRDVTDVGIVIQCYLRDFARDLVELRGWSRERGTPVWVRLVKGAYWDYETVLAQAAGWPIPVFQQKWQSDAGFEAASRFVIQNYQFLRPALGTHNVRSIAHAIAVADHLELPKNGLELQMLYGMADVEKQAFVDAGRRMRIYMPYGELIPGMAYLVRRLLENTSNESFLRAGFVERRGIDELLRPPEPAAPPVTPTHQHAEQEMAEVEITPAWPASFHNQPPVDFAVKAKREAMQDALEQVVRQLGQSYPLVVDGVRIETDERLDSIDPSFRERLVGNVAVANEQHVASAVSAAKEALPAWAALGAVKRAEHLQRAAEIMRRRFFELAAWQVYECAKGWREATGDVCEAIDFCEFYSQGAVALTHGQGVDVPGEENRFHYLPRGVTAVIAPWNFPLAILTGMTTAALATGNTVVMKPSEQASVVAAKLMEVFGEADLPAGVVHYLPGPGASVGASLVEHPDVAVIAFTGSRSVGLSINARAAEVSARGIGFVKRVIAEMGGKNAIIVDSDADLDEAVLGVVKSAFGYQGQKCSACSRAIVLDDVYEPFLARLVEAARSLRIGPAEEPATSVGPVIDQEAFANVHRYIELARRQGREVLAVDVGDKARQGFFIGPHIYADVPPEATIAREEIFGPVLAVIRAADLNQALRIANDSDYALTGGIYSRSPANLEQARRELMVGNLYLNRPITGALVGRQPFGGFRLSGIGSKAGGPDYLLQFVLPRTITENTMRRGFAPPSTREE